MTDTTPILPNENRTPLRRQAEDRLRDQQVEFDDLSPAEIQQLVHELRVHQIELEMQNTELHAAADRMEDLLTKYTDLYDFAPVGYFSLDQKGVILEANLTAATLLGKERADLIQRPLSRFVAAPASQKRNPTRAS
jgi:PAS domain-containing protein